MPPGDLRTNEEAPALEGEPSRVCDQCRIHRHTTGGHPRKGCEADGVCDQRGNTAPVALRIAGYLGMSLTTSADNSELLQRVAGAAKRSA